jgi:hypothetical protein
MRKNILIPNSISISIVTEKILKKETNNSECPRTASPEKNGNTYLCKCYNLNFKEKDSSLKR